MIHARRSYGGMCVAPHHLAAEAGRDIFKKGGNAIEAMVAAAATVAVVYPHMNGIGGDGFWLIHEPGKPPVAIDACGYAAGLATPAFSTSHESIPERGPKSALTIAGTVSGWPEALRVAADWGQPQTLEDPLREAIRHADEGVAVSKSQQQLTAKHIERLSQSPGFSETFLDDGQSSSC